MSKFLRIVATAVVAMSAAVVVVPGVAHATVGTNVSLNLPLSPALVVGATGLPADLTIEYGNQGAPENGYTNTVCNAGQNPPCNDPGVGVPGNNIGINMLLSCGGFGAGISCDAGEQDPNVFRPSLTGTGRAGTECVGMVFDIVISDAAYGMYNFVPQGGANVVLPPGTTCVVDFTLDVINMPLRDSDSLAADVQTNQIADVTVFASRPGASPLPGGGVDTGDRTISPATPSLATQASPTVGLGGTISDQAFVSGRAFPDDTGTVDFLLYGPNDTNCSGSPVFQDLDNPILSNATSVTSASFSPTAQGVYRWVASYSGDRNNAPLLGACNDANESVVVTQARPTIVTRASAAQMLGPDPLTDTATVSGRIGATTGGTVDFSLYGPDDATCAGVPIFTSSIAMPTRSDQVTSAGYSPTAVGTYRWIAEYSGDANNLSAAGSCNDDGESTVVSRAQPEITTDAGGDVVVGGVLNDKATVSGRVAPSASSVRFDLYGPDNAACTGTPVFTSTVALAAGDTMVTSPSYTAALVGTYRWVATYAGDANNNPVAGECGDPAETMRVTLGVPSISTQASPGVAAGVGSLFDVATVTDRVMPQSGATVSFRLYGPGDTTCSRAPVFETIGVSYPVAGGSVRSGSYTPTMAGTYRWIATYSGDSNNGSVAGVCGEAAETVEVVLDSGVVLPETGSDTALLLRSGGGLVFAGLVMVGLGGRRRRARHV